ncbi:50S ribosomal protein L21 [Candidatus Poribacteria bacterium]|nr:50S ribosomal protein L21 [Candidatus Poribacteria bacterium]
MYAIIECGGKQHKVSEGDVIEIENINKKPGEKLEIDGILFDDNKDSNLSLKKAKVTSEVVGETSGPKVVIYKLKRRKNYNKKTGHRQHYSKIKITKIAVA